MARKDAGCLGFKTKTDRHEDEHVVDRTVQSIRAKGNRCLFDSATLGF